MSKRWLSLFLVLIHTVAFAQESKPPKSIFGLYSERVPVCFNASSESKQKFDCEGETANWVLVVPAANDGVWIQVNLLFHNGHTCNFEGNGDWKKDHVLVQKYDGEACELNITFKKGKATLSEDGRCRAYSCGARGLYDGISLPKKGSM